MRNLSWMFLLFLTVSLWAVEDDEVENQEPVVSNPLAKQLDYETVLVTYLCRGCGWGFDDGQYQGVG